MKKKTEPERKIYKDVSIRAVAVIPKWHTNNGRRESDQNWSRLDSFYDPQINPLLGAGGANELASGALNETAVQFAKPLIKLIDCKNKWENE